MVQSFEELIARYEDSVNWNETELLERIIFVVNEWGEIQNLLSSLDDIEQEELETIFAAQEEEEESSFADFDF